MALGDGETELLVVLHLVGLKPDRRVAVLPIAADRASAGRKLRQRRSGGAQQAEDRDDQGEPRASRRRRPPCRFGETCHPSRSAPQKLVREGLPSAYRQNV